MSKQEVSDTTTIVVDSILKQCHLTPRADQTSVVQHMLKSETDLTLLNGRRTSTALLIAAAALIQARSNFRVLFICQGRRDWDTKRNNLIRAILNKDEIVKLNLDGLQLRNGSSVFGILGDISELRGVSPNLIMVDGFETMSASLFHNIIGPMMGVLGVSVVFAGCLESYSKNEAGEPTDKSTKDTLQYAIERAVIPLTIVDVRA